MFDQLAGLAATNLSSPVVLFFVVGVLAALARSDLSVPDAFAKGLTIYLMLAIGFKGGVVIVTVILTSEAADAVLRDLMPLLASWRGVASVSDVQVLRPDRF